MDNDFNLPLNLREYRVRAGLNQSELSELANVSKTSVSTMESGAHANWRFFTILNIANALSAKLEIPRDKIFLDIVRFSLSKQDYENKEEARAKSK